MMDTAERARRSPRRHVGPTPCGGQRAQLDPKRMRANLDLSGGLIMAEAIMLELGTTLGRRHAHDIIYDAAQVARSRGARSPSCLPRTPG